MAEIKRFEDIEAWQRTRQLVQAIYEISSLGDFAKDFGLKEQIRRAAVSVMSNIAEGFERGGDKEFLAKASGGEVRSQLYVALVAGFMRYLQQSDLRGSKYLRKSS